MKISTEELLPEPPLGLPPRVFHLEDRLNEINSAIKRYITADYTIPKEWVEERNGIITELKYGDHKEFND
ncbi:MAG: hypothetical protein COB15_09510 [Flavobacteriales bacterium]|nr:MAG: hypothetical protein COB15_09510 [Flavobacteriales bacterium]